MFCNTCGNAISADQSFCSVCGKPTTREFAPPQPGRLRRHIQILGILWLVYSVFGILRGIMLIAVAHNLFTHPPFWPGVPMNLPGFLGPILGSVAIIKLIKSAAGIVAGIGLLQRVPWARVLTLVLAFLSLLGIPLGTALGIYTLWAMLPQDSEQEYAVLTREAAAVNP